MARIGAFDFGESLGGGGMGSVFAGVHHHSSSPVVMKTIRVDLAGRGELERRRAFQCELEAIARARHPHIVRVHDFGVLNVDTPIEGITVAAGSPFIIMDRVDGGPIARPPRTRWVWSELRELVASLLRTLAHVHALGIVHRDIKPDNVLIEDATGVPVLIDFGVARLQSRHATPGGTPAYMAPEQWADPSYGEGPWTDLYALGCMVHELLVGVPPLTAPSLSRLAELKLAEAHDLSKLEDAQPALAHWLARTLRAHPEARFSSAAEALEELPRWDTPVPVAEVRAEPAFDLWNLSTIATDDTSPRPSTMSSGKAHAHHEPLELTKSWRTESADTAHPPLRGAGLGVFALRALPMLGRDVVRDRLWSLARQVDAAEPGTSGVTLVGFAGTGKSALARWLVTALHERAGRTHLWASCDASRSLTEILLATLETFLGTASLTSRDDVRVRARRRFGAGSHVVNSLVEAMRPSGSTPSGVDLAILAHALATLTGASPLTLVLDDAHTNHEIPGFIATLSKASRRLGARVLVLATASLEAMQASAHVRERVEGFGFERVPVEPLEDSTHRALVNAALDLSELELERLLELTRGNPLHSLQLLEHWIERGELVSTGSGFARREGIALTWPDELSSVYDRRAANAASGFHDRRSAWLSMHSAALLGHELTWEEWDGVCVEVEVDSGEMLNAMVRAGFAERTPGGWRFVFGLMRERLEASCRARAHWVDANALCADALTRSAPRTAEAWRRVARHELAASRAERALDALENGFYDLTLSACEEVLTTFDELPSEALTPRLDARLELARGHVALMRGELDETRRRLEHLGERIQSRHWDTLLDRWTSLSIEVANFSGHTERGITLAREALDRSETSGDATTWRRITYLRQLGELLQSAHRLDEAAFAFEEAMGIAKDRHPWQGAWVAYNLASLASERGEAERAHSALERAEPVFEDLGDLIGVGCCEVLRAHLALHEFETSDALEMLASAVAHFDVIGDVGASMTLETMARVHVLRGDADQVEFVLAELERRGDEGIFVEDVVLWRGLTRDMASIDVGQSLRTIVSSPEPLWCQLEVAWVLYAIAQWSMDTGHRDDAERVLDLAHRVSESLSWLPGPLHEALTSLEEAV